MTQNAEISQIKADMTSIKEDISKIAEAMTRIAVLEEKHSIFVLTSDKIMFRLEKLEVKQQENEIFLATIRNVSDKFSKLEGRVSDIEGGIKIEKARIDGALWLARTLYGLLGVGGLGAMFKLLGLF